MAKPIAEKIAWYKSPELRPWKRKLQFAELIIIGCFIISSCVGVTLEQGSKPLERTFFLFAGAFLLSIVMLGSFILRNESVSRYVRSFIILGLMAGAGGLAGFALLIMTASRTAMG